MSDIMQFYFIGFNKKNIERSQALVENELRLKTFKVDSYNTFYLDQYFYSFLIFSSKMIKITVHF